MSSDELSCEVKPNLMQSLNHKPYSSNIKLPQHHVSCFFSYLLAGTPVLTFVTWIFQGFPKIPSAFLLGQYLAISVPPKSTKIAKFDSILAPLGRTSWLILVKIIGFIQVSAFLQKYFKFGVFQFINNNNNNTKVYHTCIVTHQAWIGGAGKSPGGQTECVNC